MTNQAAVQLSQASDYQLFSFITSKRKIDNTITKSAQALFDRVWNDELKEALVINYIPASEEPFKSAALHDDNLKKIAELSLRAVMNATFQLRVNEQLGEMKTALSSNLPGTDEFIRKVMGTISEKTRWSYEVLVDTTSPHPFQQNTLQNLIPELDDWLKSTDDWALKSEQLKAIIDNTPKFTGVPLLPTRENATMQPHIKQWQGYRQ